MTRTDNPAGSARRAGGEPDPRTSPARDRFLPGAVVAGRYRIVGLVGRGGMGEVYRADDLRLGQPVALKFLPPDLARDGSRRNRLDAEARSARRVTHPNVCRVHDIGEVDGQPFLSMEFVDGEDLGSLLRRIGRLPRDKAIEIARQLCAGLAAAHEQGVLHRDLKPSNVMIDGRGKVRITDFGLALSAADATVNVLAGTPAYMAPEQFSGNPPSIRSDLYALGLLLYEICTGRDPFAAPTFDERLRLKRRGPPSPPSRVAGNLDPEVDRIILRCLEPDPAARPASAPAVAAALPGDPLAAALLAGETPSPDMVANAADAPSFSPTAAWACLVLVLAGLAGMIPLATRAQLTGLVPLDKSPEVLVDRARTLIRSLGYTEPPADSDFGFGKDRALLKRIASSRAGPDRWQALTRVPPFAVGFWYRQSPAVLLPYDVIDFRPSLDDPPAEVTGMVSLELDPAGRLTGLQAVPPEHDPAGPAFREPDWSALLRETGIDPASLVPAPPEWTPNMYADSRAAWIGAYPQSPGVPLRIEAASYHGRPVALRLIAPWSEAARSGPEVAPPSQRLASTVLWTALVVTLVGGALIARRNLRLGRGDRRGAFRIAVIVLVTGLAAWVLRSHHVAGSDEIYRFIIRIGYMLFVASTVWGSYLAIEPAVRRLWPRVLVSWVRLLDGRFRDPLVGRDVLLGLLAGLILAALSDLVVIGPGRFGLPSAIPGEAGGGPPFELWVLQGLRSSLGTLCLILRDSLALPMLYVSIVLLARIVLRSTPPAIAALVLLGGLAVWIDTGSLLLDIAFSLVLTGLHLLLLFRLGLLGLIVATLARILLTSSPLTLATGAWYFVATLPALVLLACLAGYGFHAAMAGRPLFSDAT
jgi:hypothetical protein